jgi:hypothetical protein
MQLHGYSYGHQREIVPIQFIQQISSSNGTICDYSNTGQLSLMLPSDVTYTSASGVFLTQAASSAPEPSSLLLIGLGLAASVACAVTSQLDSPVSRR